jgi:hypothetical protein
MHNVFKQILHVYDSSAKAEVSQFKQGSFTVSQSVRWALMTRHCKLSMTNEHALACDADNIL